MRDLTQDSWNEQISNDKDAVIIDVRRPDEWDTGIIENALLINIMNIEEFQRKTSQFDNNKSYYIYCRSGARSAKACHILDTLGFGKTYNLLGGMLGWNGKTVLPEI